MRRVSSTLRRTAAIVVLTVVAVAAARAPRRAVTPPPPTFDVYAIRYASIPFRVSGLIAGADTSRRMDIAMMVWLLKGPDNRNVLVDAGFHRADLVTRW